MRHRPLMRKLPCELDIHTSISRYYDYANPMSPPLFSASTMFSGMVLRMISISRTFESNVIPPRDLHRDSCT